LQHGSATSHLSLDVCLLYARTCLDRPSNRVGRSPLSTWYTLRRSWGCLSIEADIELYRQLAAIDSSLPKADGTLWLDQKSMDFLVSWYSIRLSLTKEQLLPVQAIGAPLILCCTLGSSLSPHLRMATFVNHVFFAVTLVPAC
jgi:hypothetical protein